MRIMRATRFSPIRMSLLRKSLVMRGELERPYSDLKVDLISADNR